MRNDVFSWSLSSIGLIESPRKVNFTQILGKSQKIYDLLNHGHVKWEGTYDCIQTSKILTKPKGAVFLVHQDNWARPEAGAGFSDVPI